MGDDQESTAAWVASGLAELTGRADGPALLPSVATIEAITALADGAPVDEPLVLLGERASLAGRTRAGAASCGGSARLLPTADGWIAVNLARAEDVELLPAWLGPDIDVADPWAAVTNTVAERSAVALVRRAAELGLPVSTLGEAMVRVPTPAGREKPEAGGGRPRGAGGVVSVAGGADSSSQGRTSSGVAGVAEASPDGTPRHGILRTGGGARAPLSGPPLVVDLSSLWAGPLCSHLLGLGGARVVKVESTRRPDGGRRDESGFFDLLNHDKASVAIDLPSTNGLARLRALLVAADVVIEGSRPRALRGWGIDAEAYLAADDGPRVWVSITAHGRMGPAADRVGFGDEAAAAGGLVVGDDDGPCFLADAVADPLTGIAAAQTVGEALADGGTWLLDAALARVAASVARPGPAVALPDAVPSPRSRPVPGPARSLGADTDTVLADLP